jgi:hypothetical protein
LRGSECKWLLGIDFSITKFESLGFILLLLSFFLDRRTKETESVCVLCSGHQQEWDILMVEDDVLLEEVKGL